MYRTMAMHTRGPCVAPTIATAYPAQSKVDTYLGWPPSQTRSRVSIARWKSIFLGFRRFWWRDTSLALAKTRPIKWVRAWPRTTFWRVCWQKQEQPSGKKLSWVMESTRKNPASVFLEKYIDKYRNWVKKTSCFFDVLMSWWMNRRGLLFL